MKLRIEFDENIGETEIIIRCAEMNDEVAALQKALSKARVGNQQLVLYKEETEYFMPVSDILFFESDDRLVKAHTVDNVYQTGLKLYELEAMFSQSFMRVSKSSIVNINKIYAISRDISGSSVKFSGSVKEVYVSRMYFKPLKEKMEERRL